MAFVHLHLHSEYSLLDGACRVSEIPKAAKANGADAVAITDHGVMYGAVDFYRACKAEGVKPIIGCEVYVASNSRFDKRHETDGTRYHLILLCKNETGYRNLIYMVSKSFTEGFYTKPRIDTELLECHHEGLIALSACLAGYIPRMITAGEYEKAEAHAVEMDRLFGRGNYYLELQDHGIEQQTEVNKALISIAAKTGIPLVATNDVHYLKKTDADTQAVLMCIQTNNKISEGRPFGFETDEFYFKTEDEMRKLFRSVPEAIENTQKIADMCGFDFDFSKLYLPRFKPENGGEPNRYLSDLAYAGFDKKVAEGEIVFTPERTESLYRERIAYELSVVTRMGYAEYYLIVWDFIRAAKDRGIPTGPGRGSGAGSLVAFLIGITDVDSIKYELMFERFLNPERVSMPDFDTDFCYDRRGEVIDYVSKKYGEDHVCGIITFGTLSAKAVVRDVGRVLGMSFADTDVVAKAIPNDLHVTLRDALNGKLGEMYDKSADIKKLIDISLALEGMPRHASAHAAGIVITDKPVWDYVPVAVNSELILTQFPMDTVAKLGLLKFDFLGLRYLTIISDTEKQIREYAPDFSIKKIDFDDKATYELISAGKTDGVFQLESGGMRKMLISMQPRTLEDIIIAISLYRPGPMESIPRFLSCRENPENIEYDCPQLEHILKKTSGCIVYQEQVMQICRDIAGFSYGKADVIRRAMSKKHGDEMEKERNAFIYGDKDANGNVICTGAVSNGLTPETATKIFDTMSSFASYAFNKSHATAYAYLSYRTAYLKCHYPGEYLASLLTSVLGNVSKTAVYISEAQKNRVPVLAPDINESYEKYHVVGEPGKRAIRFGLLGIKNVGVSLLENTINERRKNGAFTSFTDFVERMSDNDLNKRQIEGLIKSGAFDNLGVRRSALLSEYEKIIDIFVSRKKSKEDGQLDFFSLGGDIKKEEFVYDYPDLPELSWGERLRQEKEATGMYFSGHPADDCAAHAGSLGAIPIGSILLSFSDDDENAPEYTDKQKVIIAGIVSNRVNKQTRNGDAMAFVTLEDRYGEIENVVFPKILAKYSHILTVGSKIAVSGNISVSENAPPKILVSDIIRLDPDFKPVPKQDKPASTQKSSPAERPASAPDSPKTMYIKLPSFGGDEYKKTVNLLGIYDGAIPVVLYDAENKKYLKTPYRVSPMPNMLLYLKNLLGDGSVVLK